jgi:hypothetical protein
VTGRDRRRRTVRFAIAALIAWSLALAPGTGSTAATAISPQFGTDDCTGLTCYELTIKLSGSGSGVWQSTNSSYVPDSKLVCHIANGVADNAYTCSYVFADVQKLGYIDVYFTATPLAGNQYCLDGSGFSNCFGATIYKNYVRLFQGRIDIGAFQPLPYQLSVTKSGSGSGTVVSTPSGINCGSTCTSSLPYGTSVLLTALPAAGSTFGGWTGACTGQPADCLIGIIADTSTAAVFTSTTSAPPTKTARPTAVATGAPAASGRETPAASTGATEPAGSPPMETNPSPSTAPVVQPVTAQADLSPIVLAILGAGVLIAIGFGIGAYLLRSRPAA